MRTAGAPSDGGRTMSIWDNVGENAMFIPEDPPKDEDGAGDERSETSISV